MKRLWAVIAAIILALLCALGITALVHRVMHKSAPPNISALVDSLKETAEKKLNAPALANEQLVITAPNDKIEARAKEVIDAAIQAGGTAVKTNNADGTTLLLVQIPGKNDELFRGLIHQTQVVKQTPPRAGETQLIEVTIKPE